MSHQLLSPLFNHSGKAESKVPATILILFLLGVAYWGYTYGMAYYNDFIFKDEIQKALKYDPYKVKFKPSLEVEKSQLMAIAKKHGIVIDEKDPKQYMRVDDDGKFFKVDLAYKVIIKHPIGEPKVMYFSHQILPNQ